MPPPTIKTSTFSRRLLITPILSETLSAAQDGDEGGVSGLLKAPPHDGDFFLDQVAADSGEVVSHTGGGSMGSVSGTNASLT